MSDSQAIDEIRLILDSLFNGIIIDGFGCGIYTLILAQAIWKLRRKGNKLIYSISLILLWMSTIAIFACDWSNLRAGFVVHNDSPIDIFEALNVAPPVVKDIAGISSILIADAILIWRCNILWKNKFILISLLVLYITTAVFLIRTSVTRDPIIVLTSFIASLASAMTTATATFFIVLKIVLVTRKSHMQHSYTKAIKIIAESGALVSILMLAEAVLQLISFVHTFDLTTSSGKILTQLLVYVTSIHTPIIGIGPTLIAFRVAEESPQTEVNATSRSSPLSRLTFRRTARDTTSDSQARDPHVSTIRFMSAQEEENLNSSQGSMVVQTQTDNQHKHDEHNNLEAMGALTGAQPVMV